jgi:hypothetical protein
VSGREHSQVTGKVIDHTIKVLNTHVCMYVFLSITLNEMGEEERPAVYPNPWFNRRRYNRGAVYYDIIIISSTSDRSRITTK